MDYSHSSKPEMKPEPNKPGILDVLPPKTAFIAGFVCAFLVAGTLGFVILGNHILTNGVPSEAGTKTVTAPTPTAAAPTPVPSGSVPAVTDDDHIRGDKNAEITLIEYSDFECPFCSRFIPTTEQVLEQYDGQVRLVYRHFPLSFHPNAESAANASECAGEQGKFWEFHDELFANQGSLSVSYYKTLASQLGLNAAQFSDCVDSNKYAQKVRDQATSGAAAGVTGTPGSFVVDDEGNAVPIKGALPFSSVQQVIESML